jgi:hypothetical protein
MTLQEFDDCKRAVEHAILIALLFLEERTGMKVLGVTFDLDDDAFLCEFRFGGFLQEDESTDEPESEGQ